MDILIIINCRPKKTTEDALHGAANGPCVRSAFLDFDLEGKPEFDLEVEGQGQQGDLFCNQGKIA